MTRIQGDLRDRSFQFAQDVLKLVDLLPQGAKGWTVGRQLVRSGTSIGANVREADNALTDAEFAHKCSIARKEASETHYWLDLCIAAGLLPTSQGVPERKEADELTRILSAIVHRTHVHLESKSRSPNPPSS